mmetsp:Transcript_10713/g.20547  ORF Transcript_10713/g.20547 Transcript_10713/m.20547 type:complete len:95 (-) Transcript_10713:417-701(-)
MVQSFSKMTQTVIFRFIVQMFSNSFAYVFRIFNKNSDIHIFYFSSILKYYWKYLKIPIRRKLLFLNWKTQNNHLLSNMDTQHSVDIMITNIKVT